MTRKEALFRKYYPIVSRSTRKTKISRKRLLRPDLKRMVTTFFIRDSIQTISSSINSALRSNIGTFLMLLKKQKKDNVLVHISSIRLCH